MEINETQRRQLDEATSRFRADGDLPGVVLGVTVGAELVHVAAAAGAGQPEPRADTRFRIASMTKSFTATAVLLLRDRGLLALDDPVGRHVPELAGLTGPTSDAPPVTIRGLLSMGSGLAGDDPWADRLLDADVAAMDDLFTGGATFALTPGTGFVYSNFGYAMLGRVITRVAGAPFQEVITAEVLEPLGTTSTGWQPPEPPAPVAAALWRVDGDLVAEPVLADGGFAAMGGLWSTVADLARWCGWLLDAFPPRDGPDGPVLGRASRREMQQVATAWARPRLVGRADGVRMLAGGYGYGLNVAVDDRLGAMVQHSGGLPGYGSNMRWLPDRNVAAVALANLRYAPAGQLTLSALDLLQAEGVLPTPRGPEGATLQARAEALVALLNGWSEHEAARLFSANVDLDEGLDRRRTAAADRLARHGPLIITAVTPRNRAEADVEVTDGRCVPLTLALMLSPEPSGRIQWYQLREPATAPEPADV